VPSDPSKWDKGCTCHHSWRIWETKKTSGGLADPWGNRLTLIYLVLCYESVVDVVQRLCGRSQVCMSVISFGNLPHTCSCTWCCLQTKWGTKKQKRDSTGSRTKQPLLKFKYKFTMRLAQTRMAGLGLPFHLNQARWLTPFRFEIPTRVSPHIQPISM
jgi:hypothetical protein